MTSIFANRTKYSQKMYELMGVWEFQQRDEWVLQTLKKKERIIKKFMLTKKQLYENGFPVSILNNTFVLPNEYQRDRRMFVDELDHLRVCTRCRASFWVKRGGFQKKAPLMICKDKDGNSYPFHIHDQQPLAALKEFKRAHPVHELNTQYSGKLFGLDVEMVYTSHGQAVARVSMVDHLGEVLVDSIVKPEEEVYDPVTKYSGIKIEDFKWSTDNWFTVREIIICHINQDSILVGHGLYGDLKALKIIHEKVIDTSVLFTNDGKRPSLRYLTSTYLNREIQTSTDGHCSEEDAIASLELVYFAAFNTKLLAPMYTHL